MRPREEKCWQDPAVETGSQAEPRQATPFQAESKSIFIVFLELFYSRWMLICGIFFSASFWSYLTLARAPDTYEANAQILIRRGKIQAIQDVPILRQQEEVGSEVDILLSIAVIDEAVDQMIARARASGVTDSADPNARQQRKIFGLYEPTRPYKVLKLSDLPVTDPAFLASDHLRVKLESDTFVGVGPMAHGWRGSPVPIIESRVTRSAS